MTMALFNSSLLAFDSFVLQALGFPLESNEKKTYQKNTPAEYVNLILTFSLYFFVISVFSSSCFHFECAVQKPSKGQPRGE